MPLPGAHGLPTFAFDSLSGDGLRQLPTVPVPFGLNLSNAGVTDADLRHLKRQPNLAMLNLLGGKVTDEGLRELRDLTRLTYLNLADTQVTERGLVELKNLTALTYLDVRGVAGDAGLEQLEPLANLRS